MTDTTSFPPLKNDLIIRAARGEKTERAPVWVMRQAGRYLPEFRAERVENDFFKICRTPELATKVTLQPIDRYDGLLDASIIFSDILVIPQAMGMTVEMVPGKGPHFPTPLVVPADMAVQLKEKVDVHKELQYVFDAITMTRHALNGRVPLIGFVGAPWTLMAYMIEGGGSKTLSKAKEWIFKHPKESHELLGRITDVCVDFLIGQVHAGAQMLQVFESWGGELGPHDFEHFSLPYLAQIAKRVKSELGEKAVPMTVFAKGSWYAVDKLSVIGYETVSLDWTHTPESAKAITQGRVTLQGNMDPNVLYGGDEAIVAAATRMVRGFGSTRRYIANLGHGILPTVPVEAMELFLKTVHRVGLEVAAEEKAAEDANDMKIIG
ncbi:Uroporphyrinogen decarboxylase in heme biosynthesis [Linnemannia elongata]|uniref:Uroporphyrinogen decarboxylase n=1 Tax=Linnemannia elongata AG-77 TaxID=1314771 RepID=A0A197K9V3_9FUNG|nr:Uroporphyrinogen decarboxylase in heme biosynthesis [Linnemannia elongata]KAF9324860.1 Uroporphyrinogen decarboxylase in heme biosynthesis [Linnemannia elongata]OAQ34270.1 uroporphyrinogen decarboxylase [Linnemannia elongata AG-77]